MSNDSIEATTIYLSLRNDLEYALNEMMDANNEMEIISVSITKYRVTDEGMDASEAVVVFKDHSRS